MNEEEAMEIAKAELDFGPVETDEAPPPLYDWQMDHAAALEKSLREHGVAKDGSDTGTGKTVVALEVARRMEMVPFVICPKSVIPAWAEWYYKFFPAMPCAFVTNYEKLRTGDTSFVKKGRGGKSFEWYLKGNCLLIFDEDHRCKSSKSLNSKLMQAAARQGYGMLLLGATSCTDPTEMKAIGHALKLHKGKDWWGWCLRNGCERGRFGGLNFNQDPKTLKYLHESIYGKGLGSRLRIRDIDDFPETLIMADSYDVADPGAVNSAYEEMASELKKLDAAKSADEAENSLTIMLRARQEVELLKVPTFVELASDALGEGNSVALFISFRDTLAALERRLSVDGWSVSVIHGDQTEGERQSAIEEFRTDQARVIVCMTQAGGVGISLHDSEGSFPRVSLISPTFSAIDLKQALGRVHRADGKSKSVQKIVFAAGTVEDAVCRIVRRKLNNLDLINDDELNPIL